MNRNRIILYSTLVILSFILFYILNSGVHWKGIFQPVALGLIQGKNPYENSAYFNPPWALIPLIPFALLPTRLGSALYAAVSMVAIAYTAYKMGARKWILVGFLIMPLTFFHCLDVNIDWMVALGYLLPPMWGLPLVLLKPQLGIGITFFWAIQVFKEGGLRKLVITFLPVGILFAVSFLIFGNYFARYETTLKQEVLWFTSIPVAVVLLAASLRTKKAGYAIAAGPFLAPYIAPYSVPIALLGLMDIPTIAVPAMLGLWVVSIDPIVYLIQMFSNK